MSFCKDMTAFFFGFGALCMPLAFFQLLPVTVPGLLVLTGILWLAFYVIEVSR